jgi:Flp pilus assembly protein TadG
MKTPYQTTPTRRTSPRNGVAAVECALVAPLLVLLVLGAIDVGQCANVYQKVSDASRKGARVGARFGSETTSEVEAAVMEYLEESSPGVSSSTLAAATVVTVTDAAGGPIPGGDLTKVPVGSQIRVHVSIQLDPVRWIGVIGSLDGSNVAATAMMRRE